MTPGMRRNVASTPQKHPAPKVAFFMGCAPSRCRPTTCCRPGSLHVGDEDIDALGVAFEAFEDRGAPEPFIPGLLALAHDDHLDGVFPGEGQDGVGDVRAA